MHLETPYKIYMAKFENIEISKIAYICYEDAFDLERLISLFCEHTYIYVYDSNDRLYSIITIGDFKKYSRASEYMNRNFLYVTEGDNLNRDIDRIVQEKNIKEIPVLNIEGKLLYIKRKIKNIIYSFNFDWTLCSNKIINQFFNGYKRICYFNKSEKVKGLQKLISSSTIKMEQINSINDCKPEDVFIIHNEYLSGGIKAYNINEIYLNILSKTVVQNLLMHEVNYFFFQTPLDNKFKQENRIYYQQDLESLSADTAELINCFGDCTEDIKYITQHGYSKIDFCEVGGRYLLKDAHSDTYNVHNNQRVTLNQPIEYRHTIYVFGTCIARGYGVSDGSTISSLLQMQLNRNGFTKYRVVNYGTGGGLNTYSDIRDFVNICKTDIKEKDIVIHLGYNCWELDESNVKFDNYYELSELFNQKHEKRCFIDAAPHLTPYANGIVSEYIFSKIKNNLLIYN